MGRVAEKQDGIQRQAEFAAPGFSTAFSGLTAQRTRSGCREGAHAWFRQRPNRKHRLQPAFLPSHLGWAAVLPCSAASQRGRRVAWGRVRGRFRRLSAGQGPGGLAPLAEERVQVAPGVGNHRSSKCRTFHRFAAARRRRRRSRGQTVARRWSTGAPMRLARVLRGASICQKYR
jgi:hypothetical protein